MGSPGGAADELWFHTFGAFAQSERALIAERTREGLKAAPARDEQAAAPDGWTWPRSVETDRTPVRQDTPVRTGETGG